MFLDDLYLTEDTVSVDFKQNTTTYDSATGRYTDSYSSVMTVNGLLWVGKMAENYISDKFKAQVDALFIMNYDDYTVDLKSDARAVINGNTYDIIGIPDNIANQNEVVQIMLKEFK